MQSFVVYLFAFLSLLAGFYFWKYRRDFLRFRLDFARLFRSHEEMYQTIALGLYHRFKLEEGKSESPWDFEHFVKEVLQDLYGGEAFVTPGSGDMGVDIKQTRQEGLFLGQVKCYALDQPVSYEPIAILHSQMINQQATGGFIVTTSTFSESAKNYLSQIGANIELIDGQRFIHYWAESCEIRKGAYHEEKSSLLNFA